MNELRDSLEKAKDYIGRLQEEYAKRPFNKQMEDHIRRLEENIDLKNKELEEVFARSDALENKARLIERKLIDHDDLNARLRMVSEQYKQLDLERKEIAAKCNKAEDENKVSGID